ncbi:hypothetical protein Bbelb_105700 [Branchiostoma belcheri]|nr:hypothetical protein Bbelb_105700 [Branchiostoma belcheri]
MDVHHETLGTRLSPISANPDHFRLKADKPKTLPESFRPFCRIEDVSRGFETIPMDLVSPSVFVVWLGALILAVPDAFPPTVRWYQTLFRTANAVDAVCPRNVTKGIPKVSATYYDIKTWWLLGCYFCLPVLFGLVCFCLSSRRLAAAARANKDAKDSHKLHLKQSHQTARIVLFLVLAFAFCWLPYHVSTILWRVVDKGVLQKYRTYMVILDYAGFYLSNFQSCVNPLVLFTMSEAWRKALNDCCPCCYCFCCCCRCVEVLCCPGRRSSKDDPDKLDTELQTVTGASR